MASLGDVKQIVITDGATEVQNLRLVCLVMLRNKASIVICVTLVNSYIISCKGFYLHSVCCQPTLYVKDTPIMI